MLWWGCVWQLVGSCVGFAVIVDAGESICTLTDQQVWDAIEDGTIHNYCPKGKVKDREGSGCIPVTGDGETMPYYNNCTLPIKCHRCHSYFGVEIDEACRPKRKQTCKCKDPSMVLIVEGNTERCKPPPTTDAPVSPNSAAYPANSTAEQDPELERNITTNDNKSISSTHIVIGVLGAVAGILLIMAVILVVCLIKSRRRKSDKPVESQERLVSAANPILPYYRKKWGTILIIYDEVRQYVKKDIKHASNFAKFLLEDQPRNIYKEIKAISAENVLNQVEKVSTLPNLGDMLITFVLCHGDERGFRCGSTYLDPEKLITLFYGSNCKALLDKPKVFIFLHCRGVDIVKCIPKENVCPAGLEENCNEMSDLLIVHSSWPSTKAFIDEKGSWLLQDICEAAQKYPQEDLMSVLAEMIRLVEMRVDKYRGQDAKQQPVVKSTLKKRIYPAGKKEQQHEAVQASNRACSSEDNLSDEAAGGYSTDCLLPASEGEPHVVLEMEELS